MGESVQSIHAYLSQFGYFPNDELAREYPAWRPLVSEKPAISNVYDEHTAAAVRRLQHLNGLAETGIADSATRALLKAPRCGNPDGDPRLDPSDKFNVNGWSLEKHSATWAINWGVFSYYLSPYGSPVDGYSRIINALDQWSQATSISFQRIGEQNLDIYQPDFFISFSSYDPLVTLAKTDSSYGGSAIYLTLYDN